MGKSMDNLGEINYDLAILMNKYDSYNKWKVQQQQLENEKTKLNTNINFSLMNKVIDESNKKETSLETILDEVF
jgi:hypothetical protein